MSQSLENRAHNSGNLFGGLCVITWLPPEVLHLLCTKQLTPEKHNAFGVSFRCAKCGILDLSHQVRLRPPAAVAKQLLQVLMLMHLEVHSCRRAGKRQGRRHDRGLSECSALSMLDV